jgi:uncharacterized RDD family membrane protein YckC
MGMKVIVRDNLTPCTFRESILRNLPLSIAVIFAMFPFLGWLFFSTGGLLIIGFESYLIFSDEEGTRIGDILADTLVVEEEKNEAQMRRHSSGRTGHPLPASHKICSKRASPDRG